MRTFIAIELDTDLKNTVLGLVRNLQASGADVRWTRPAGFHLTLAFLGEVDESRASKVKQALAKVVPRHSSFPLVLQGTGAFPGEREPRVLWVGFAAEPALMALQADIERELEALGFPPEKRNYHPHLTLGRVKGPRGLARAMAELGQHKTERLGAMTARKVAMFESLLRPEGAEYRVLNEVSLA